MHLYFWNFLHNFCMYVHADGKYRKFIQMHTYLLPWLVLEVVWLIRCQYHIAAFKELPWTVWDFAWIQKSPRTSTSYFIVAWQSCAMKEDILNFFLHSAQCKYYLRHEHFETPMWIMSLKTSISLKISRVEYFKKRKYPVNTFNRQCTCMSQKIKPWAVHSRVFFNEG